MCTPTSALFVGIDIAQQTAPVSWLRPSQLPSAPFTVAQTPEGFTALRQRLAATQVPPRPDPGRTRGHRCVLVPAGAAERGTRRCEHGSDSPHPGGVPRPRVPRSALRVWEAPPPAVYHEVEQRLQLRQQLLDARQTAQNQLHALRAGAVVIARVQTRLEARIAFYDEQLAALEAEIPTVLPAAGEWAANFGLLLSIKGIGQWTALGLRVATVNFTSCARRRRWATRGGGRASTAQGQVCRDGRG